MATATRTTHADEYIEHWAKVYEEKKLSSYGIIFEVFLNAPHAILRHIEAGEFRPLLTRQKRAMAEQLDREATELLESEYITALEKQTGAVLRDSGYVQPMRHTNHHRRAPRKHVPWNLKGVCHE